MPTTTVVVIGAGPAGLAVSHELGRRVIDHVVLERGRTAESWRSRRWDSLRLLSPAWATRLPGLPPPARPDAYPTAADQVATLERCAAGLSAPVVEHADVLSVRACGDRYRVVSTAGGWSATAVVVATGDAVEPAVPPVAGVVPAHVHQADRPGRQAHPRPVVGHRVVPGTRPHREGQAAAPRRGPP